jgi:Immunoglobulin-like domain of bacterial spore germination/Sporulation and spore germination
VKRAALLLAVAAAVLLSACGGDDEATQVSDARMYFLLDGKVWPVANEVEGRDDVEVTMKSLDALVAGLSEDAAEIGMTTAIRPDLEVVSLTTEDGTVQLELSENLSGAALAQVVYTATQSEGLEAVEIDGTTYTRADFEDQTPSVLVESPLPFEEVTGPVHAQGTANTFEATFNYELTDTDGRIVDENFVTASSGTGTRGTFEFTTDDYEIPFDGIGSLIVFERSAEDGSKIHIVEIPLRMSK